MATNPLPLGLTIEGLDTCDPSNTKNIILTMGYDHLPVSFSPSFALFFNITTDDEFNDLLLADGWDYQAIHYEVTAIRMARFINAHVPGDKQIILMGKGNAGLYMCHLAFKLMKRESAPMLILHDVKLPTTPMFCGGGKSMRELHPNIDFDDIDDILTNSTSKLVKVDSDDALVATMREVFVC